MTNAKRHFRRGITIPEVITSSVLFVLLLAGLLSIGVQASSQWSRGTSRVIVDDAASMAVQAIARDVRDGLSCTTNGDGAEVTVVMPLVNAQGDFDRFTDGVAVRYYRSGTTLYRKPGEGTPQVLGKRISRVHFAVEDGRLVIELTTRQQLGARVEETQLATQISLRNEVTF